MKSNTAISVVFVALVIVFASAFRTWRQTRPAQVIDSLAPRNSAHVSASHTNLLSGSTDNPPRSLQDNKPKNVFPIGKSMAADPFAFRNQAQSWVDRIVFPVIDALHLSPDKLPILKERLIEREMTLLDTRDVIAKVKHLTGPEKDAAYAQATIEIDKSIRGEIGGDAFNTLMAMLAAHEHLSTILLNEAPEMAEAGIPMNSEQIISAAIALRTINAAGPMPPDNRAIGADELTETNRQIIAHMSGFLSPPQVEIFKNKFLRQNAYRKLKALGLR